jgi:urate oxidase
MIAVAENQYGKSRVRLVKVERKDGWHELREWTISVLLQGDFDSGFVEGDNSKILPTDTMKNTVYSLARDSSAACLEDFAKELVEFFLQHNPQVSEVEVGISEKAWEHLQCGGQPQPTTFIQASREIQTTNVARRQKGDLSVASGFEDLVVMKTSGSAFGGYIQDSLTTLPPSEDRLLGTAVNAHWRYAPTLVDFGALRAKAREILLTAFAGHESKSVQHTLYAMGKSVLEQLPEVEDIALTMPNKHCLLVDLSPFGQNNPNEIFVPVDEPHGNIQARLRRQG